MTGTPRLVLTILAVRDLPGMAAFYSAAFGWQQTVSTPVYAEFVMSNGQRLGLYHHEGFKRNTLVSPQFKRDAEATSHVELYFACDDVTTAARKILAAGGRMLSPLALRDWGDEAAYYADPEGNVIVLARTATGAAVASP